MFIAMTNTALDPQGLLIEAEGENKLLRIGRVHVANVDSVDLVVTFQTRLTNPTGIVDLFSILVKAGTNEYQDLDSDVGKNVGLQVATSLQDGTQQSGVRVLVDATLDVVTV
jgi:hypothetical protein